MSISQFVCLSVRSITPSKVQISVGTEFWIRNVCLKPGQELQEACHKISAQSVEPFLTYYGKNRQTKILLLCSKNYKAKTHFQMMHVISINHFSSPPFVCMCPFHFVMKACTATYSKFQIIFSQAPRCESRFPRLFFSTVSL